MKKVLVLPEIRIDFRSRARGGVLRLFRTSNQDPFHRPSHHAGESAGLVKLRREWKGGKLLTAQQPFSSHSRMHWDRLSLRCHNEAYWPAPGRQHPPCETKPPGSTSSIHPHRPKRRPELPTRQRATAPGLATQSGAATATPVRSLPSLKPCPQPPRPPRSRTRGRGAPGTRRTCRHLRFRRARARGPPRRGLSRHRRS